MKSTLVQAILFSSILLLLYFGISIGYGFYLTLTHVPQLNEVYQSNVYLQNEVAFGTVRSPFQAPIMFLSGIIVYYIGYFFIRILKSSFYTNSN